MNDEELMKALAAVARERKERENARWDERFDLLAAGELPPEDRARLEQQAKASPDVALALSAFEPFDQRSRDRFVDRLQRFTREQESPTRSEAGSRLFFFRRPVWTAICLAAAAAVALIVFLWPSGPSLPPYSLSLGGEIQAVRGPSEPTDQIPRFGPGSILEIVLRPETAVEAEVQASVFLEREGQYQPLQIPQQTDPKGSIRLRGVIGKDVDLPPGDRTVWIGLGFAGQVPDARDLQRFLESEGGSEPEGSRFEKVRIYVETQ